MTPQEPYLAPRACRFDDKRGYVKSSARVGECRPERSDSSGCHPERAKRVEGSRAAPAGTAYGSEPMAASDVAFLAPELVSEAEGPVPVPAPAEGRLGYRFVKRAFDIAFSLCAIAVLLVPSIVLCIAIRVESPGCPIYSQKRVGRIGRGGEVRAFDMYKFRSMHKDADERLAELAELNEADGPLFKIKDDPRVTRIGRFIRKHSIDELPQFLNCLMGQISCVGPRPPLPSEVTQYDERAMRRLSVKPGLTGYWQVRGRSDTGFEEMVDMDLWIANASHWFAKNGYRVVVSSFCKAEGDENAVERVAEKVNQLGSSIEVLLYRGDAAPVLDEISKSEVVVATRFHAMVLGLASGAKVLSVPYSKKAAYVMADIGFDRGNVLDIASIDPADMTPCERILESEPLCVSTFAKEALRHFRALDDYILKSPDGNHETALS